MPKAAEKSWSELRLGIVVTAIGLVAGLVVFFAGARRGPFLPDTYTLYVELDEAAGIRVGSPVRVGGIPAGEVVDVAILPAGPIAPAGADTLEALLEAPDLREIRIELSVQERFRPYITPSSRARLATIGLGGERYVQISAGDVAGEEPLPVDGEIPTAVSIDWDLVLARLSRAVNEMAVIAEIGEEVREKVERGEATIPAFLDEDAAIYAEIEALRRESEALLALVDSGPGVVPRWSADPRLEDGLDRLWEAFDRIGERVGSEDGALDRWADPEELRAALDGARAEVDSLREALDSGHGTAGRLLHDEELWNQIRVLEQRVTELVAAFRADPLGFVDIDWF